MLQSKKGNLIISLILAVALWMYVVGEMNPTTSKIFRDIPITLMNEQTLTDQDLAVVGISAESLNLTLTGKRSDIGRIKSTDISAYVDLTDAGEGDNQLTVSLHVPSTVDVKDQNVNKVTVTVEKRVDEEKEIRVVYNGDSNTETEPTTTLIDPATVTVSGSKSRVDQVAYVMAQVNIEDITENEASIVARLTPVDKSGEEVENVTLSEQKARIQSVLLYTKSVKLEVPINDEKDDGYERTTKAPDTILIKGNKEIVDAVETISTETVDISQILENESVELTPILPEGVEVAEGSPKLILTVSVKSNLSSKEFKFSGSEVQLTADDGVEAAVATKTITVTVEGTESEISGIRKSDISLTADASGLDEGTNSIPLNVNCSKDYTNISASPEQLKVTITIAAAEPEETDNTEEEG